MKIHAFPKRLVFSFGVILFITGVAKIWSSFGSSKFLATPDPVIGIAFSHLMLATGLLELGIAFICWRCSCRTKSIRLATFLVAWLSTIFLGYRLGMWWMHWKRPCGCLGNLTDALHISPVLADDIMKVVLAYLFISSYGLLGLLIRQWMKGRSARTITPETALTQSK